MSVGIHFISGINEGLFVPLREGQELTLGRKKDNDVVLPHDSWASSYHATVKCQRGFIYVKDLGSTNGTFLAEERIQPKSYKQAKELFVVGSTLFQVGEDTGAVREGPLAVDAVGERLAKMPLCVAALKAAGRASIVNIAHVFLALVRLHRQELAPLFARLGIDPDEINKRLENNKLFRGKHAWLNRFLALTERLHEVNQYLTPLARYLITHPTSPKDSMRAILCQGFNLVFPLMDWERRQALWEEELMEEEPPPTVPSCAPSCRIQVDGYLLPLLETQPLWQRLDEVLSSGGTALLTGDSGCGKTALTRLAFSANAMADLSECMAGKVSYFDPKVYFNYYSPRKVQSYVDHIVETLGRPGLAVIDHFPEFQLILKEREIDDKPLLRGIKKGVYPLILVVDRADARSLERQIPNSQVVDLNTFLDAVLPAVHKALIKEFETASGMLNKKGKRYFLEMIAQPYGYNIRGLKDLVDLAIRRAREFDNSLALAGQTTSVSMLSEAIFKEVFEQLGNLAEPEIDLEPEPEPKPVINLEASPVTEDLLDQIENLFHNFSKQVFKVSLRYSDRTEHLADKGRLSREQKLDELKSHLVHLVTAFQSAFPAWFEETWLKLDPEMIREELGRTARASKLWAEFEERARHIDTAYAEDLFHQTGARILRDCLMARQS